MSEEELININGIREDLYQAMQIGDITLNSKHSQELYNFMNYQDKEIERLNKCYCERTDCSGRIKNSKKYESMQEEIERLKEELEFEKTTNKELISTGAELENKLYEEQDKNKRLNNIINEFEKLLKEERTRTKYAHDVERFTAYDYMLKRLQELKGSDKE